jgi:hypothetical protein
MALDLFASIQVWNDTVPIEKDTPFSLEDVPTFPRLMTPKSQRILFHFIVHTESAPDRIKAFDIYCKIFAANGKVPLASRTYLVKKAECLLNSLHTSHVESGVAITRLISIEYADSSRKHLHSVLLRRDYNVFDNRFFVS